MQQATGNGHGFHVHFCQNPGGLIGMFKIGFTGFTQLTAVGFPGKTVDLPEKILIGLIEGDTILR